jgi:hypothetical protein
MADMLSVTALQLRDPVLFGILVKADDASIHGSTGAPNRRAAQPARRAQVTAV